MATVVICSKSLFGFKGSLFRIYDLYQIQIPDFLQLMAQPVISVLQTYFMQACN